MKDTVVFVLGGGRGARLYPLTKFRSKPAVPLGGKYRLIDIPLSNRINSGLNRIYVLTQFNSVSLHRHISRTYVFDHFDGGFVEILAAQQTMDSSVGWYQGTADAVRQHVRYIDQPGIKFVLILSGDQLYRMNYEDMHETHRKSNAEVTIAALPVVKKATRALGVMRLDDTGRVLGFLEKPQSDEDLSLVHTDSAWIEAQGIPSAGRNYLANMGIYLFNKQTLLDVLSKTNYHDFGKEIFPASVRARHVQAHLYDGYWEDIGTIKSFFQANLDLAKLKPSFELASAEAPIFSRARYLPAAKIEGATISQSLIADGCKIAAGAVIENSIIGLRCHIGPDTRIRNSILMGADFYQTPEDIENDRKVGNPPVGIGSHCLIENAIIDKNCRVGNNVHIVNSRKIIDSPETPHAMIVDGIVNIPKETSLPDGWSLESELK